MAVSPWNCLRRLTCYSLLPEEEAVGMNRLFSASREVSASLCCSPSALQSRRSGIERTFLITSLLILYSLPRMILGSMNFVRSLTELTCPALCRVWPTASFLPLLLFPTHSYDSPPTFSPVLNHRAARDVKQNEKEGKKALLINHPFLFH